MQAKHTGEMMFKEQEQHAQELTDPTRANGSRLTSKLEIESEAHDSIRDGQVQQ